MSRLCPTCGGTGHLPPVFASSLPTYYCNHDGTTDTPCLFWQRAHCTMQHRVQFRAPADMQEDAHGDWGYFRPGYHHRLCPDRRMPPVQPSLPWGEAPAAPSTIHPVRLHLVGSTDTALVVQED